MPVGGEIKVFLVELEQQRVCLFAATFLELLLICVISLSCCFKIEVAS